MTISAERQRISRRPFSFVELDLNACGLTYGTGLCQAVLGVTGSTKCFNTRFTCQDPVNFDSPGDTGALGDIWLKDSTSNASDLKRQGTTDGADNGWLLDSVNPSDTALTVNGTVTNVAGIGPGNGADFAGGAGDYLSVANNAFATYEGCSLDVAVSYRGETSGRNIIAGYGDLAEDKWAWLLYIEGGLLKFGHTAADTTFYSTEGSDALDLMGVISPDDDGTGDYNFSFIRKDGTDSDQVTIVFKKKYNSQRISEGVTFSLGDFAGDAGSSPELIIGSDFDGVVYTFRYWGSEQTPSSLSSSSVSYLGTPLVGTSTDVVTDEDAAFRFEPDGSGTTAYVTNVSGVGPGRGAMFPASASAYLYSSSTLFANEAGLSCSLAIDLNALPAASDIAIIIGYGDLSEDKWDWLLYIEDGLIKFAHTDSGGTLRTSTGYSLSAAEQTISFIRKEIDSDEVTLWVDGTAVDVSTLTAVAGDNGTSPQLIIGYNLDATIYSIHGWFSQQAQDKVTSCVTIGSTTDIKTDEDFLYRFEVSEDSDNASTQPLLAGTLQQIRFYDPHWDAPEFSSIPSFPCLRNVSVSPTKLDPEKGLGRRAQITIELNDFPFHDRGIDPYVDDRTYDVEANGTFLARYFTRQRTSLLGRTIRFYTGYKTKTGAIDLSNFESRVYEIQEVTAPDNNGVVKIVGKDPLKRADEDKSQAPLPTTVTIAADITNVDTEITVTPLGGEVYRQLGASGYIRIGSEVMGFTATTDSDTITVTRGQFNTDAEAHSTGDVIQLCLYYGGVSPSDIYYDLLVNYAGVSPDYINKTAWDTETDIYIVRNFTRLITEPTSVKKLIDELAEQTPFYTWWDERASTVRFRALRPAESADQTLTDASNFLDRGFNVDLEDARRLSQIWTYIGITDPTTSIKEARNYGGLVVTSDLDSESVTEYDQSAIKKIFGTWLSFDDNAGAQILGQSYLNRYRQSPWSIRFSLDAKDTQIWTGSIFNVSSSYIPSATGEGETTPFQCLSAKPVEHGHLFEYEALEYRTDVITVQLPDGETADPTDHILTIFDTRNNYNIRTQHDALYGAPVAGDVVKLYIYPRSGNIGGIVGSESTAEAALTFGDWPAGVIKEIHNLGHVAGRGGDGGRGASEKGGFITSSPATDGSAGGLAVDATGTNADFIWYGTGTIYGGGGGGGGGGSDVTGGGSGGGGGGGAGVEGGTGGLHGKNNLNRSGDDGTLEAGGRHGGGNDKAGNGGDGGAPGEAGQNGEGGKDGNAANGGAAGAAISGVANITFIDISPSDTNYVKGAVS